MKNRKQFFITLSLFTMFIMGIALRLMFLPAKTLDMLSYTLWYDYIAQHGIIPSLGGYSFGYNPPYIYLLSLATLTRSFLPKIVAIKLIPLAFDLLNVVLVYQIVKTRFPDNNKPLLAALLFWIAPTVMVNSAFWGQTDSLYTCFLLLTMLYLLKDRPIAAVIAFALSVAVKAQGVFLAPLLGVLFFQKRIRWHTFLFVPVVYIISFLPMLLAGRPLASLLSIYVGQAETFKSASKNAANLYFFAPQSAYQTTVAIGFTLATLLLLIWVLFYGMKRDFHAPPTLILAALVSVALVPFLLPKMHDRYFYPADVFSLIAAFFIPEIWFVPIAYQFISMLSYQPYLFGIDAQKVIPLATAVNTLTLVFLLWKQGKASPQSA